MITSALSELFERDLQKLKTEMELFKNEDNLWVLKIYLHFLKQPIQA